MTILSQVFLINLNYDVNIDLPIYFEFIKLCFGIPFLNAKVEIFFNFMKIIKTDWRSQLGAKNLTSLRIKVEGPNLDQFARKYC